MHLQFNKVSNFKRGILHDLLSDAYSFDSKWRKLFETDWKEFDNFFFDNPQIADKYGFITTFNNIPIGFISWNPSNLPDSIKIGHNCIASEYKGNGFGKIQLQEAIDRIITSFPQRIIVTTNTTLIPAQQMYQSVGFKLFQTRKNDSPSAFSGDYIDYQIKLY